MELIMQPTSTTCGQTCIAMIAGKNVEEVIKDMKTDAATSIGFGLIEGAYTHGKITSFLEIYG